MYHISANIPHTWVKLCTCINWKETLLFRVKLHKSNHPYNTLAHTAHQYLLHTLSITLTHHQEVITAFNRIYLKNHISHNNLITVHPRFLLHKSTRMQIQFVVKLRFYWKKLNIMHNVSEKCTEIWYMILYLSMAS